MTEHTAGPWRAEICPDIAHEYPAWVICADASPYKAGFAHFDGKDAGPNAFLAAAAPALLAAAEAAAAEADAFKEYSPATNDAFARISDLLRAAISQARGEA